MLDELMFRACAEPLAIQPDLLDDFVDHLADVIVGRFEVAQRGGPPMEEREIWRAVHAALLHELRFRGGSEPLIIEPDRLTEYAASLADVTVGRFEVSYRVGQPVAAPRRPDLPRDPFSYFLELRRRYVRDWYWTCAAIIAIGLGIASDSRTAHPFGLLAGLGLVAAGVFVGYLGYRRGKGPR